MSLPSCIHTDLNMGFPHIFIQSSAITLALFGEARFEEVAATTLRGVA